MPLNAENNIWSDSLLNN